MKGTKDFTPLWMSKKLNLFSNQVSLTFIFPLFQNNGTHCLLTDVYIDYNTPSLMPGRESEWIMYW